MNQPAFDEFVDWEGAPARGHSSSSDQRRRPETLRTAIAMTAPHKKLKTTRALAFARWSTAVEMPPGQSNGSIG
jgi:hypothetical protein